MKFTTQSILKTSSAVMAAALFSSCVDPYATTTVTSYRPGYEIQTLPQGYRTEEYSGTRYYSHNGTYYRPQGSRYIVVEAPRQNKRNREIYVDRLPPGYYMTKYAGRNYYRVGKTYYQQRGAGYVVVERPF